MKGASILKWLIILVNLESAIIIRWLNTCTLGNRNLFGTETFCSALYLQITHIQESLSSFKRRGIRRVASTQTCFIFWIYYIEVVLYSCNFQIFYSFNKSFIISRVFFHWKAFQKDHNICSGANLRFHLKNIRFIKILSIFPSFIKCLIISRNKSAKREKDSILCSLQNFQDKVSQFLKVRKIWRR